jgi:hypothetical protein
MIAAMVATYFMLRYGPQGNARIATVIAASTLLIMGFLFGRGSGHARWKSGISRLAAAMGILCAVSVTSLFLLHAPSALEEVSDAIIETFVIAESKEKKKLIEHMSQGQARSGNWLWTEHTIRPLPRRAHLRPGNRPEVFLQFDDPADARAMVQRGCYVSAFALGTYRDAAWSLTPATGAAPSYPRRPGNVLSYEVAHATDPSGQSPLIVVQGLRHAEIAPLSYRGDGITILPPSDDFIGYRYRAQSQQLTIDDLAANSIHASGIDVASAWLQLPVQENLVVGIRGLVAESVSKGTLKQQLVQLRDSLRTECRYSLDISNPRNLDPLENFLFHEKSGHCELFATAGAIAARSMGIPARVAYGWSGGSYYDASNLFVFRAREAHAWTEVLVEDVGWVVMDCTPEEAIGRSRAAEPSETPLSAEEQAEMQEPEPAAELDMRMVSAVIAAVGVSAAVVMMLLLLSRGADKKVTGVMAEAASAARYYREFVRLCQRKNIAIRPHVTLRQLLGKFSPRPSFGNALQRYHYGLRYGKAEADAAVEKSLQDEIRNQD